MKHRGLRVLLVVAHGEVDDLMDLHSWHTARGLEPVRQTVWLWEPHLLAAVERELFAVTMERMVAQVTRELEDQHLLADYGRVLGVGPELDPRCPLCGIEHGRWCTPAPGAAVSPDTAPDSC